MSLFDKKVRETRKKCGCACNELSRLRAGDEVSIMVDGEALDNLTFVCLDDKKCCVTFFQTDVDTGERRVVMMECDKIDVLFMNLDDEAGA